MKVLKRVVLIGAGLAALVAGLLVGATACSNCELYPVEGGVYEIAESPDRPELVGAIVDIGEETVEIDFTDAQGNDWSVTYAIKSRYP